MRTRFIWLLAFVTIALPALAGVESRVFGKMPDGQAIEEYTLRNGNGMRVSVITYGAILREVQAPDRVGALTNVVLGVDTLEGYLKGFRGSGAIVGRVANRIAGARYTLDGQEHKLTANNSSNHLHGILGKVVWTGQPLKEGTGVKLSYVIADGADGFPGTLQVSVTYTLTEANELRLDYAARTDKATPVNLTSHAYFNLAGHGDVLKHELWLAAARYTPVDDGLIPTGQIAPVKGTPLDFTTPREVGARIGELKPRPGGYDHNYVLDKPAGELGLAARVREPGSGRVMEVRTTEPGVQFFTAQHLEHRALCLETQHFPDSVNHPNFPSTILRPGEEFRSTTLFAFTAK